MFHFRERESYNEQDVLDVGVTRQGKWTCENGNLTATSWYAENVGLVKTLTTDMGDEVRFVIHVARFGR